MSDLLSPKVRVDYLCPYCHWKKCMIYRSYKIAKFNRVYCDMCITREMKCITPNKDEKIAILN